MCVTGYTQKSEGGEKTIFFQVLRGKCQNSVGVTIRVRYNIAITLQFYFKRGE